MSLSKPAASLHTLLSILQQSRELHNALADTCGEQYRQITNAFITAFQNGNKALFCGNGGSAADAQHVAAELVGRFQKHRQPLPAIALTTDTSLLTSISNDYGYNQVFSRQVEALAQPGDLVVGISTSGASASILLAMQKAKEQKALAIGFTGHPENKLMQVCDLCLCVPSTVTARIQEAHILLWHALCEEIEETLFPG